LLGSIVLGSGGAGAPWSCMPGGSPPSSGGPPPRGSGPKCFHLLLCGAQSDWDRERLAGLRERYQGLVAIHRLTREAAPGVLHDSDGTALARLGVDQVSHYLVRPDGYVAYRCAGSELLGVERYLARWLPGAGANGI
jgi:hypothetical protein